MLIDDDPLPMDSMEILQMPHSALQERVNRELVANPTLEQYQTIEMNREESAPFRNLDFSPDVIVNQNEEGKYHVLVDEHIPQLRISRRYHQMLKDRSTSPEAREFIQRKIQAARWLIESIEQRRSTILKVAKAIINFQREFLDKGSEHIQPLKMQEIDERVGVHVTTVSRAVDDKWIQTPRGIFPLKRFFGGGTTTASGEEVAWEIVQQKLKEVIDQEDKANPLSHDEIVAKFKEQGIDMARRTITKYRKKMGIPSSRERKQF